MIVLVHFMPMALPEQAIGHEDIFAEKTYHESMLLLDKEDKFLSYNDLLKIYGTITASEGYIPGLEKILLRLMEKRNDNPRVDQMILIFTAKLIGESKQEISHVTDFLEALLLSERANLWTVSFVAGALGDYYIDLKDGDHLADMIDRKIERLTEKQKISPDEFYGYHFLPPPTTQYIRNIISSPKERQRREATRLYYYSLLLHNNEEQIKNYLVFLDEHGHIDTHGKIEFSMKYLFYNIELIQAAMAKEQISELP